LVGGRSSTTGEEITYPLRNAPPDPTESILVWQQSAQPIGRLFAIEARPHVTGAEGIVHLALCDGEEVHAVA
jgi:hypothetical protein